MSNAAASGREEPLEAGGGAARTGGTCQKLRTKMLTNEDMYEEFRLTRSDFELQIRSTPLHPPTPHLLLRFDMLHF